MANRTPTHHVAVHVISVIADAALALSRVHAVRPLEWLTLPVAMAAGSLFVYSFHRFVLHVPRQWSRLGYVKHGLYHHRFFTHERFGRDERADLHAVLFPWPSGAVVLGGAYLLARGLSPLLGGNVAYLTMLVGVLYFKLYELVHACFHLPDGHWLTRAPGLAPLREHHRLHHDPALSARYNFNVVLPLFDPVFGTMATPPRAGVETGVGREVR
jgi:Fatty acid hydroxylase